MPRRKPSRAKRQANELPPLKMDSAVGIEMTNKESFRAEARWQRDCALCGKVGGPFHAHHVIYEQELKRRHLPKYDTRNSRRVHPNCHGKHHSASRDQIKTTALTDDNIRYAYDKLEAYATDYLRAKYDDSEADPRILAMEREFEREREEQAA